MTLRTMDGTTRATCYKPRVFPDGRPSVLSQAVSGHPTNQASLPNKRRKLPMQDQRRIVATLAETLGNDVVGEHDLLHLGALYDMATRFSGPIIAESVIKIADTHDSFMTLGVMTTNLFGSALVAVHSTSDPSELPKQALVKMREIMLGVARAVANPTSTHTVNWRRANAAAEFVSAIGKYTGAPTLRPIDAVWWLLSGSSGATMTTHAMSYRKVNWYGMLARVAISQSVIDSNWDPAAKAMEKHPGLRKECMVQIHAMEKLEQVGDSILAIARHKMDMSPRKNVPERDGVGDWVNEIIAEEGGVDKLSDEALFQDWSDALDVAGDAVFEVPVDEPKDAPYEAQTPPGKKVARRQTELGGYFRITKMPELSTPVDLTVLPRPAKRTQLFKPPPKPRGKRKMGEVEAEAVVLMPPPPPRQPPSVRTPPILAAHAIMKSVESLLRCDEKYEDFKESAERMGGRVTIVRNLTGATSPALGAWRSPPPPPANRFKHFSMGELMNMSLKDALALY